MSGFTYNGVHSSNYGLNVLSVQRGILPPITARLLDVPGRPGSYYQGRQVGARTITVDVQVTALDYADLRAKVRAIAAWLMPGPDPKPLVFDEEPDKTWYAVLSGDTDLDEVVAVGNGKLTFIAPDPVAVGPEHTVALPATVNPAGTAETYPIIRATVNQDITHFAVATPDRYVLLGRPVADQETPASPTQVVFSERLTSTSGWQLGSVVQNGIVTGSFGADAGGWYVQDYGQGDLWHGPALQKSFTPIQDFKVTVNLQVLNGVAQYGRGDVYLLDANGSVIGQISVRDHWAGYDDMWVEFRVGPFTGGVILGFGHGPKAGWWSRFSGQVSFRREGSWWKGYVALIDGNGNHYRSATTYYNDAAGAFAQPLAAVELHAGASGTYTPCTVRFLFAEVLALNALQPTETPYIAHAGDVIEIDNERFVARINGEARLDLLDPGSEFFALTPGQDTPIDVTPPGVADVSLTYRERWW